MSRSDWLLGDFDGNKFAEVRINGWSRELVGKCDYVMVNGVKFVNQRKVHEDRVRGLEDENVRGRRLQSDCTR